MKLCYNPPELGQDVKTIIDEIHACAEMRRRLANFKTGSITKAASAYLWTLCEKWTPKIVVEIGTFIGNSTKVFAYWAEQVYTCDKDNDCLQRTETISTHPKTTSTDMLWALVQKGIKADLFFFDGRIQAPDLALIFRLSTPNTIYLFDDYERMEKGVLNVGMLFPYLPEHQLVQPPVKIEGSDSYTSIAALLPKELV